MKTVAILLQYGHVLITDPSVPAGGEAKDVQRVFHIVHVPDTTPDITVHVKFKQAGIGGAGRVITYADLLKQAIR